MPDKIGSDSWFTCHIRRTVLALVAGFIWSQYSWFQKVRVNRRVLEISRRVRHDDECQSTLVTNSLDRPLLSISSNIGSTSFSEIIGLDSLKKSRAEFVTFSLS